MSRDDPEGTKNAGSKFEDGVPTDGLTGMQTRRSMQLRRSMEGHYRSSSGSISLARAESGRLMHDYHTENGRYNLDDLAEDSEGDSDGKNGKRTSFDSPDKNDAARPAEAPRRPSRTFESR